MTDTKEEDQLIKVLNGEDDLGAVIRAHIHIEAALNDFIEELFEFPDFLDKIRLEFHEKILLAQAIGLKTEYAKPLNTLGTLRNNFAHRIETTLGKNEVDSLYKSFDGEDKQIIQNAYLRTKKSEKMKGPKSVTKLNPREQFTLIAISIRQILVAARSELARTKGGNA